MKKTTKTTKLFIEDLGKVSGGGLPPITTMALGEEGGGPVIDDPIFTTLALGEEDGGIDVTTLALGEEDGGL